MEFKKIFELLADHFERERVDYALIGAFALKAYGYTRATQDVDFMVRGEAQEKIIAYLESLGFETLYRSKGYSNHMHPLSRLGRLDFVYVRGETAEKMFRDAKSLLVFKDIAVKVVSPEHLAALKIFAMKNNPDRTLREMADLKFLLSMPDVDRSTIKGYFEKYGQEDKYRELVVGEEHGSTAGPRS